MSRMHLPLWLKILWTIWVIAWAPLYWRQYGAQNFLYFCDLGNFLIAVGLWLESPLIFSWQATALLLFQTLFAADLLGAFLTGKHWIGGTEFMFDAHLPLFLRLLSLFHVVTPPFVHLHRYNFQNDISDNRRHRFHQSASRSRAPETPAQGRRLSSR